MAIGIWNTAYLGDAVLTLPLIQTIFCQYPDEPIHFFVRKGLKPLFEAHSAIARVHEFDKAGSEKSLTGMLHFARIFEEHEFRLWISAHTSLRSAFMARLSRAKTRIGYKPEFALPGGYSWAYTDTVPRHFGQLDEIERLLQLAEPLGIRPEISVWPEIVLPQVSRERATEFWTQFNGAPVLGVHPGSVWPTKRWPLEYFAEIVVRAVHENAHVLVFGGPGAEEELAAGVLALAQQKIPSAKYALTHNLAGALSLPDLAAYLALLNCYVTNDSGPMHLAWPQLTPVTAIFGPTTAELGFAPRGPFADIIESPLPCRPCGKHGHKRCPQKHLDCMRNVTPDMVWESVQRKLFRIGS